METFSIELPQDDDKALWIAFQEFMDNLHDQTMQYIKKLAIELDVSESCASDVWYLRTRSRHTQDLENELIRLYKASTPPNINEFGSK